MYWLPYGFNKINFNFADPNLDLEFVLDNGLIKNKENKYFQY